MRSASAIALVVALFLLHTPFVQGASSGVSLDSTASSVAPEPALLSPDEQSAGFVRLWSETKYNFAFFDKVPDVDWDKVLEEYLPRFNKPRDKYAYYTILEECLARLQDTHTRVNVYLTPEDDRPSILVRPIEGKAVITIAADDGQKDGELVEQGITVGCEILKVDGRDVKDILEKDIYPCFSASTPQMRDRFAYQHILDGPPRQQGVGCNPRPPGDRAHRNAHEKRPQLPEEAAQAGRRLRIPRARRRHCIRRVQVLQ